MIYGFQCECITILLVFILSPRSSKLPRGYSELPAVDHEVTEMLIVVNRRWNCGIVIIPLGLCDGSVVILVSKVWEEFKECFVFGDFSRNDLWMGLDVISALQIGRSNWSSTIAVEFVEGLINYSLSFSTHSASKSNEELIKVDSSILIGVEMWKENVSFGLVECAATFVESNKKFLGINSSVSIPVNRLENSS